MRRFANLSVFLSLLIFPQGISAAPLSSSQDCSWIAQGTNRQNFGTNGQSGKTGENGGNGANSDNLTIFADGTPLNLNLAGKNGEDGQPGGDAIAANCENQPSDVSTDLVAPDGCYG